jgi:ectoine hydroxylase-related dioxygenase (phytanoyl-CoA dioxygenase family)
VIPDIAADLLGPNVRFREIMMNFKWAGGGAEVKWHQDLVFYPHTNVGTCQFLVALEDVGPEQGPLQVVPGSHKGPIFAHYNQEGEWTGAIADKDMADVALDKAVTLTGRAGSVSVHHSLTVHGSDRNMSSTGRPVFVITFSAADAIPYTAPPYPSSHYGKLVRGEEPGIAHHEALQMPLPPDWSDGYTSIFAHQDKEDGDQAVEH